VESIPPDNTHFFLHKKALSAVFSQAENTVTPQITGTIKYGLGNYQVQSQSTAGKQADTENPLH